MSQPPDTFFTDDQGQQWRAYWSNTANSVSYPSGANASSGISFAPDERRQFESEPVSSAPERTTLSQPEYGPLPPLRVFSFGGGVQSVACEVLAAQGKIDYQQFVFCNVGDDSENPATLEYYHQYALPYAKANGLTMTELKYIRRDGSEDSILKRLTRPGGRSIGIPVRMKNGAPGRRSCTVDFKIRRTDRWLRQQGAKRRGAILGMGISLDEFTRMKTNTDPKTLAWKTLDYPLIDLRLDRAACIEIIRKAGLPVPPKSACWFCPFHTMSVWQEMRRNDPEQFNKAASLEAFINNRRAELGRDPIFFTARGVPLPMAISEQQPALFEEEVCDSGYCFV